MSVKCALTGAAVGALDGVAVSRDINAGRSWTSPGIGLSGPVVVGWGWAPAVQVGSVIVGTAATLRGSAWGRDVLTIGLGLFARAAALTLSQHAQASRSGVAPAATQG